MKGESMKTYDVFWLTGGQWHHSEQITAPSRRRAMRAMRQDPRCSHGFDEKRKPMPVGECHGKFKVRLA
jgi:hypothetical protein